MLTIGYCGVCGKVAKHSMYCPVKDQPVGSVLSPYAKPVLALVPQVPSPTQNLPEATTTSQKELLSRWECSALFSGPSKMEYRHPTSNHRIIFWNNITSKNKGTLAEEDFVALWAYRYIQYAKTNDCGSCPACLSLSGGQDFLGQHPSQCPEMTAISTRWTELYHPKISNNLSKLILKVFSPSSP